MTDMIIEGSQVAELQELINSFARSGETLTKAYTVLLEQHEALTMVVGVVIGCFRAYDPDFVPLMIAGLEKVAAERGNALSDAQREFLAQFAEAAMIEPGVTGSVKGVATH
jgi:hypothetical protein